MAVKPLKINTGLSKKDQAAVAKAYISGGGSSSNISYGTPDVPAELPAARGNEFAPAFEAELKKRGISADEAFNNYSVSGLTNYFSGQGSLPQARLSSQSLSSQSLSPQTLTSQGLTTGPSITLPSAPSYSDPGRVNNGGLVNALSEENQLDAESNLFVKNQQDPEAKRSFDMQRALQDLIPKRENINDNKQIRTQNAEVMKQKQVVSDYTSQLNSVVAKQNADLLNLRGIGSQEGVTETVYGGQQATINREAAVKALPIQAALAGAQGNLQLAQDYLSQLKVMKQEEIDNNFQYKMQVFGSIKDFVTNSEKTRLDKLERDENRSYQERRDNVNAQDQWAKVAISNGQSSLVSGIANLNPASPTFTQDIARYQSQIKDASNQRANASSLGVAITPEDQRTLVGGGFGQSDISQLQKDINQYGVAAILDDSDAPADRKLSDAQKAAIRKVYGVADPKKTREQIASAVTAKVAQDVLEKTYSDEEMKRFAEEDGMRHWYSPWSSEKENWLASEKARQRVIDLYAAQE